MAEVFKNFKVAVGNTATTLYTCPASTTAIVFGLFVANIDGTNSANCTVTWTDSSDSDAIATVTSTVSIPPNATLNVLGGSNGKLVLEDGDVLKVTANAASDLYASGSVLEITA